MTLLPPPSGPPEPRTPPVAGVAASLSSRTILRVVLVILAVVFVIYLVWLLRRPLSWIFIAGFLAIALSGPVNRLSRHMRRGFAITIVYLLLLLIPVALMALLVPPVVEQLNLLAENLPRYVTDLQDLVQKNRTLRELEENYNITQELQQQAATLPNRLGDAAGILRDIGLGLVNSIFAGLTILVLSLFMIGSGRESLDNLARRTDPKRAEWLERLFTRIGGTVGAYVAAAFGQALVAAVLAFLVLSILGVPYAASLAVIIFLLDLVPLVGATIGAVIVGIVTAFSDFPVDTIIWTVWAIAYQQIENNVIQPRIQARALSVHPFIVLVSVLFGSTLFGILGALVAIPVAAAIQIVILEWQHMPRQSSLVTVTAAGTEEPALTAPPPPPVPGD